MRTDYPSGLTYYYQDDHEGSVTHLMLANGTVIESYRYDAFGAPTITTTQGYSPNNRFMFTGREYIRQFSIYEYRARLYHPGIGRFMSEDPKGFDAGDYNLFRYCKNDPEDLTDPSGMIPLWPVGYSPMEGDVSRANSGSFYYNPTARMDAASRGATMGNVQQSSTLHGEENSGSYLNN